MRAAVVGLIVVLISGQIQPNTSEAAESEQQLSGLKAKLMKLREVLEHINSNLEKKEAHEREKKSFSFGQLDLNKFKEQLSPEDQKRLDHLQSKIKYLKAALQEKTGPNPGDDDKGSNKRSDLPEEDGKLKQFEEELSSNDQDLIQRMRSKVKYLTAALAEDKANNPGDTEEETEKTEDKREEEEVADSDIVADLSPQIQALLKKYPSKLKFMKTALEHKDDSPGDDEEVEEVAEANDESKREQTESSDLDNFIDDLSPKNAAVLKKLKSKLQYLKQALLEEKTKPHDDKDMKTEISDGKFGSFVDTRQKRVFDEPWHDSPVPDEKLGVGTDVLHDTEKRLISDVREAKAQGVDLRSLLRALHSRASARRSLDEESELEKLRKGGA